MPEIDLGPVIGPQGPKGDTGPQGEQGPQGPQGPAGEVDMDAAVAFTEASTRTNINSGESIKTIFGKIKKYFADLKPHAFKAPANNFTTTDATTAAAAPTVKQLKEDLDELNSALLYENTALGTDGSTFNKNFLSIGSDARNANRQRAYFIVTNADADDWQNVPEEIQSATTSIGMREVFSPTSVITCVKLTMFWPVPGRQYYRTYNGNNGAWNDGGWKKVEPQ